jgi:hypothetical protein
MKELGVREVCQTASGVECVGSGGNDILRIDSISKATPTIVVRAHTHTHTHTHTQKYKVVGRFILLLLLLLLERQSE